MAVFISQKAECGATVAGRYEQRAVQFRLNFGVTGGQRDKPVHFQTQRASYAA